MAITNFDIAQLYRQAWGTVPYVFPAKGSQDVATKGAGYQFVPLDKAVAGEYGSPFYTTDVLGREVFCPVKLNGIWLDYPTVRIEGSVNIVSTPMVERKGSVHEIISTDDYQINIRGLIINHYGGEIDDAKINTYFNFLEANKNVEMRCVLTDRPLHEQYQVIVKRVSMPELFGVKHVYRYEMELVSDFVFTLELE